MTNAQKKMMEILGLSEEDFEPQATAQDIAEEAYLKAEYNSILLELMMEE